MAESSGMPPAIASSHPRQCIEHGASHMKFSPGLTLQHAYHMSCGRLCPGALVPVGDMFNHAPGPAPTTPFIGGARNAAQPAALLLHLHPYRHSPAALRVRDFI